MFGDPIRDALSRYGDRIKRAIRGAVVSVSQRGGTVVDVVRGVRREAGPKAAAWRMETTGVTETTRSYRAGIVDSVERSMRGEWEWEWRAMMDGATCINCASLHGRRFPRNQYPDHQHPGCRCQAVPAKPDAPARVSGDAWLRDQPEDVQRRMLGGRVDAFRGGTPLSVLVTPITTTPRYTVRAEMRRRGMAR